MFGRDRYGTRVPNERELRIIELVAQGLKNTEIAEARISEGEAVFG
jgi:DNA-binding NarL/FixJ family response regulator